MDPASVFKSATLLLVLLNPFLLSVYLLSLIERLNQRQFTGVLVRAVLISGTVFCVFAVVGDALFRNVLQVRFASFLVFGGVVFVIVALRFMFEGPHAIEGLRGEPEHLAGAVAMPFMIGPGTLNAAVLAGSNNTLPGAFTAIVAALGVSAAVVWLLKLAHDVFSERNARLVEHYVDVCGRTSALVIGALAIEMIFLGLEGWLKTLGVLAGAGSA